MIPYDERLETLWIGRFLAPVLESLVAWILDHDRPWWIFDGFLALQDFVNARLTLLEIESKLKGLYYNYQWNGLREKLQGTIYRFSMIFP